MLFRSCLYLECWNQPQLVVSLVDDIPETCLVTDAVPTLVVEPCQGLLLVLDRFLPVPPIQLRAAASSCSPSAESRCTAAGSEGHRSASWRAGGSSRS